MGRYCRPAHLPPIFTFSQVVNIYVAVGAGGGTATAGTYRPGIHIHMLTPVVAGSMVVRHCRTIMVPLL